MQTAMEELIEYIEEFTPKNKTTSGIWSKAKSLIEMEREQIVDANNAGYNTRKLKINQNASDYYNEMFKTK